MKKFTILLLLAFTTSWSLSQTVAYNNVSPANQPTADLPANAAPAYRGGDSALSEYTAENLRYPEAAYRMRIEGTVLVSCYIEKDGSISQVEIKESINPDLDDEAVRFVQNMPAWLPARQNGQFQRVKYIIPIRFSLTN